MSPCAQQRAEPEFTPAEHGAMTAALEAAARGVRGANPVVGAAILSSDGHVLHTGHHRGAGTAHAEADALHRAHEAGTDLSDTRMVVTLEPCHHTGRTGPCSMAILNAGIKSVIFAVADGSETARGGGAFLSERGVRVRHGLMAEQARELNERWFATVRDRRPFVTLKIAQSLDGKVAAPDGTSQWITGAEARNCGHAIRSRVDAILVGGGTVRVDNPTLTARDAHGAANARQPLRAVMSRTAVPKTARIRNGVGAGGERGPACGADGRFLRLDTHDPAAALAQLSALNVAHVLVEGGPTVAAAFLAADLVDELWLHQAPVILGDGKASLAPLGICTLADAVRWRGDPVGGPALRTLGTDLEWHLRPGCGAASN